MRIIHGVGVFVIEPIKDWTPDPTDPTHRNRSGRFIEPPKESHPEQRSEATAADPLQEWGIA